MNRFTTMLSASAKFIAPSIMSILSSAVAEYSVQAIFGSKKTVETVQSWMVVSCGCFGYLCGAFR